MPPAGVNDRWESNQSQWSGLEHSVGYKQGVVKIKETLHVDQLLVIIVSLVNAYQQTKLND